MKRTYLSATTCVILLFSARAEQTNSIPVVNWGKPVFGVQIADEFANPEIKPGTAQSICLKIKNSSTNVISLGVPWYAPSAILTNSIGKKYELQHINDGFDGMLELSVAPGETKEDCKKMIVPNEVKPGDYILVAQPQKITTAGGKVCTLVSGVQTVHVK